MVFCSLGKTTRPFLRTLEFCGRRVDTHATEEEAMEETIWMLNVYAEFCENVLAILQWSNRKRKVCRCKATYTIEPYA